MIEFDSYREISLIIDTYDDLFSDFDPRPFSQRELSQDFLKEMQQRYLETPQGKIQVLFTLPIDKRDATVTATAKKRIREHFELERKRLEKQIAHIRAKGVKYLLLGSLGLVIATVPLFYWPESLLLSIGSAVLTPVAWYGAFSGSGLILDDWKELKERVEFCRRFEKANYIFGGNEPMPLNPAPPQLPHV